jgi:tripartite-type tricarboxylate transporter receptor subunit TctC
VRRLNAAINEIVREEDFAKHFAAFGYETVGGSSEEFAAFLKDDIERYRQLTRAAGIAPE